MVSHKTTTKQEQEQNKNELKTKITEIINYIIICEDAPV
jgi:hypothetical protein